VRHPIDIQERKNELDRICVQRYVPSLQPGQSRRAHVARCHSQGRQDAAPVRAQTQTGLLLLPAGLRAGSGRTRTARRVCLCRDTPARLGVEVLRALGPDGDRRSDGRAMRRAPFLFLMKATGPSLTELVEELQKYR